MKKYIIIGLVILAAILVASIYILYTSNRNLKEELDIVSSNQKAFIAENSALKDENIMFRLTVEQLKQYNDSILIKMNNVKEELKIKDKNLKQMQYLLSEAQKKDTIMFRDTIFSSPSLNIDTILGDQWYKLSRWFQKKHKIVEVEVVERSPYIENKKQRFVEILKQH